MTLIDRHILARFLTNFVLLFMLLFLFAVAVDMMVALGRFIEAAHEVRGDDLGTIALASTVLRFAVDFQLPRFFQFYAYLHGLVAIGAMGFTLAQMYRHRELVATLAAGISMQRIAMPFVVGMFALSVIQLVNQELFLPRVAPLLLRDHGQIGRRSINDFGIPLTPDGGGNLFQSPSFSPGEDQLEKLTILERDERGRTRRRITADVARWTDDETTDGGGWTLTGGAALTLQEGEEATASRRRRPVPIGFYETDLSPRVLLVRRYGEFAAMLSLRQISQMLATPGVADEPALLRYRYSRFASVLVNILVMWLALPAFLLRQPANLLARALLCASISIPAMMGAAVFMVMNLPGISPGVGVFLPVIVLIPVVLAQWTYVKT